MKRIIILLFMLPALISLSSEPITDDLWLKAVQFKRNAKDSFPQKSTFIMIMKDKKGEVQTATEIEIKATDDNGNLITEIVSATRDDEPLAEDDKALEKLSETDILDDGEGLFFLETSEEQKLERAGEEIIDGIKYIKYFVDIEKEDEDGNDIDIEGHVWINELTGVPLKSEFELDPHKMMVKSINMINSYELIDESRLCTTETTMDIVVSILFKKMYMTQRTLSSNFKILTKQ
jgi:hypothetical protein